MMPGFVTFDPTTGQIGKFRSVPIRDWVANVPEGQSAIPASRPVDPFGQMVDPSTLRVVPRPALPDFSTPMTAPARLDLDGLPPGSVVTVSNEAGEFIEITDLRDAVTGMDAGRYRVRIEPPFPFRILNQVIEVQHA